MGDDVSSSVPITLHDGRPVPALTCAGPDDAQVRLASAEPSALPLPGPVRRLAEVERNRCRRIVAGRDVPPVSDDVTGFALDPARGTDEAFTAWHRETARRRELTEGRPWTAPGGPPTGRRPASRSTRAGC
ncbi:DUF664 domain-containing protein [Streptomyces sp. Vc74B-19]|nr:DUF664 domain-containing protein [Streptomyces sp. Vc74B-19]